MSGVGKKVVDVAFKAGRTIDWDGMAKLIVTDEARREFATLRRAFDEVNTQLQTKFSQVDYFMPLIYFCISIRYTVYLPFALYMRCQSSDFFFFSRWSRPDVQICWF